MREESVAGDHGDHGDQGSSVSCQVHWSHTATGCNPAASGPASWCWSEMEALEEACDFVDGEDMSVHMVGEESLVTEDLND